MCIDEMLKEKNSFETITIQNINLHEYFSKNVKMIMKDVDCVVIIKNKLKQNSNSLTPNLKPPFFYNFFGSFEGLQHIKQKLNLVENFVLYGNQQFEQKKFNFPQQQNNFIQQQLFQTIPEINEENNENNEDNDDFVNYSKNSQQNNFFQNQNNFFQQQDNNNSSENSFFSNNFFSNSSNNSSLLSSPQISPQISPRFENKNTYWSPLNNNEEDFTEKIRGDIFWNNNSSNKIEENDDFFVPQKQKEKPIINQQNNSLILNQSN
jgi:hypothetical protein